MSEFPYRVLTYTPEGEAAAYTVAGPSPDIWRTVSLKPLTHDEAVVLCERLNLIAVGEAA